MHLEYSFFIQTNCTFPAYIMCVYTLEEFFNLPLVALYYHHLPVQLSIGRFSPVVCSRWASYNLIFLLCYWGCLGILD